MQAYSFDKYGFSSGMTSCQRDHFASEAAGEDVYLLPALSALLEPPTAEGQVARWNGEAWSLEPDNRGATAYSTEDKSALTIAPDNIMPEGCTLTPPPAVDAAFAVWDAAAGQWTIDDAAKAAAETAEQQRAYIRMALAAYIEKLNATYPGLALDMATDTPSSAGSKLLTAGVAATECAALDMFYRQLTQ